MAYCYKCGNKIGDNMNFCPVCGEKRIGDNLGNDTTEYQPDYKSRDISRQRYAGSVLKCPSCGAEILSHTAFCPSCGHEVNYSKVTDSLQNFVAKIEAVDRQIANNPEAPRKGWKSWGIVKKIFWVLLNIFFVCFPLMIYFVVKLLRTDKSPDLTADEKRKASIIENYSFPDSRGDILDALIYIKGKMSLLASDAINANNTYWARIWTKKAEGLYQRAKMLFPGDKIAEETYNNIIKDYKKIRKYMRIRILIIIVIIVVIFIFLYYRGNSGSTSKKDYDMTYKWPDSDVASMLPEPISENGKITMDASYELSFELYYISQDQFDDYVDACKERGFTKESMKTESYFSASNANGDELSVYYDDSDQELSVYLYLEESNSETVMEGGTE